MLGLNDVEDKNVVWASARASALVINHEMLCLRRIFVAALQVNHVFRLAISGPWALPKATLCMAVGQIEGRVCGMVLRLRPQQKMGVAWASARAQVVAAWNPGRLKAAGRALYSGQNALVHSHRC